VGVRGRKKNYSMNVGALLGQRFIPILALGENIMSTNPLGLIINFCMITHVPCLMKKYLLMIYL